MDLKELEIAQLTAPQVSQLQEAEKKLNEGRQGREIYLLAVIRKGS